MRKDVELYIKQAEKDFVVAKENFNLKEWYVVAFFCQQAIEKFLKGLYILEKKEKPPQTHSLVFLGKELNVPKKYFPLLRLLSSDFITARYPDVLDLVPYENYSEEDAKQYIKETEELIKWIKKRLKQS